MTGWTETQWAMFFDLLDNGWPGDLEPAAATAYRVLLNDADPGEVVEALKKLLHGGKARFRPSAAEILAARRADPSRPTFEEAYHLIFAARDGILAARPARRSYIDDIDENGRYVSAQTAKQRAERAAITARCEAAHPLVGAFVLRQGIDRLRYLPLNDPDDGHWRRKELREAWEAHVEAFDGREVAVLASGGRLGLHQLDPLAALGAPPSVPALAAGSSQPSNEEEDLDEHDRDR